MSKTEKNNLESISEIDYKKCFIGKEKKALEKALDIRKFEIDLYWKRASYFWTFIGAAFAGFFVAYASPSENRRDLLVILCCLGLVFSVAWFCVNKGSKFWQENWENHVDLLEDSEIGPLYKIVLARNKGVESAGGFMGVITGPAPFSVSKINQLISFFVIFLWGALLVKVLWPISPDLDLNVFYCAIVGVSFICCVLFIWLGRTHSGEHYHSATLRESRVFPKCK